MATQAEIEDRLMTLAVMADDAVDPGRLALLISALDDPTADLFRLEKHLDDLAAAAASRGHMAPVQALADVIANLFGYRGDRHTYDDMQNANLIKVIERRRGLPVALGVLYLATAYRLGWPMVGLAFPGHFLLRLEHGAERTILDPFNDGRVLSPGNLRSLVKRLFGAGAELEPAYFQPVSHRDVVIRLLSNIHARAERSQNLALAAEQVRRMTLVSPTNGRLWAELGRLHEASGNLGAAKQAFETSLSASLHDSLKSAVESQLSAVQRRLN